MNKLISNVIKKDIKILILGLNNSGKTSLILNLQDKINLSHYTSLIPTKGMKIREVNIEGTKYIIWDIGGQKSYREEFLKKMDVSFFGTNKMIYVIDIKDNQRYDLLFLRVIVAYLTIN